MSEQYILATPKMTSNNTPSGIASCSSRYDYRYEAWYAFDQESGYDQYTWATTDGLPQWIQYQFPKAVCIERVAITNRNESNIRAIETFIFRASNDGINWTDLATCTSTSFAAHYRSEFDIPNNNKYTYYRLYVTANFNNATGSGCGTVEVELYEVKRDTYYTGDTAAIRDWLNASLYNKEEIEDLFLQNNSGLQAYDLTISNGELDQFIKLIGQTSGKIYNVCLDGEIIEPLKYANGQYTSGAINQTVEVNLGFRPSAIIAEIPYPGFILYMEGYEPLEWGSSVGNQSAVITDGRISPTDTGFKCTAKTDGWKNKTIQYFAANDEFGKFVTPDATGKSIRISFGFRPKCVCVRPVATSRDAWVYNENFTAYPSCQSEGTNGYSTESRNPITITDDGFIFEAKNSYHINKEVVYFAA